jgi:hypothetical protein
MAVLLLAGQMKSVALDQLQQLSNLVRLGAAAQPLEVDKLWDVVAPIDMMAALNPQTAEAQSLDKADEIGPADVVYGAGRDPPQ